MDIVNDRKSAIKKIKTLLFGAKGTPKSNFEAFRARIDDEFRTVFLPNGVECSENNYGGVTCDVLAPEIYSSNRVMIYIHGGSFVGGSRESYRSFCSSLATKCFCRVVVPEYRLAPEFPYPAANEDLQNVFKNLFTEEQVACALNTEKGTKPKLPEILIAADGSAASIACSLIFNLRDRYRNCIKKIILFSPWLDFSDDSIILSSKKKSDELITPEIIKKCRDIYTYESNAANPFVSPLLASEEDLKNFPSVYIQMGAKEVLLEDAKTFKEKLVRAGRECELDVWPDMMFMFQLADEFLHDSHLAVDKIGKMVTGVKSGDETLQIENKPKLEKSLYSEA